MFGIWQDFFFYLGLTCATSFYCGATVMPLIQGDDQGLPVEIICRRWYNTRTACARTITCPLRKFVLWKPYVQCSALTGKRDLKKPFCVDSIVELWNLSLVWLACNYKVIRQGDDQECGFEIRTNMLPRALTLENDSGKESMSIIVSQSDRFVFWYILFIFYPVYRFIINIKLIISLKILLEDRLKSRF